MQNEILRPVLETDETAIPRYDIVSPDGSVYKQNVELRLKNEVMQEGTPYDSESVLPATLLNELGLPTSATPAQAFQAMLTKFSNVFTKSETLSEVTAALFGLGADAVPDDVLSMLYRVTNYAWKRRPAEYSEKRTSATSNNTIYLAYGSSSSDCSQTIEYSEEIEINSTTGEVSLRNPQTVTVTYSDYSTTGALLKGKYVKNTYSYKNDILFISDSATIGISNYYVILQNVQGKVFFISSEIAETGDWSIVYAPGRNAYPDSGISNGYKYVFLGNPLDNAISAPKIVYGSYVGTGTYQSANPCTLTFDGKPLLVVIFANAEGFDQLFMMQGSGFSFSNQGYSSSKVYVTWSGNSVSWYSRGGNDCQMNMKDTTYYYVAIL